MSRYREMLSLFRRMVDRERTGGGPSSLRPMYRALAHLGHPHLMLPCVVSVVGTKGKGSTSFHLAAALEAMGYRVGLFTSPHLRTYTERIRIQQEPIPREVLGEYVLDLYRFLEPRDGFRSVFELLTLAAVQIFLDAGVEVAVFEAGLGGRLDATAVFRQDLTLLTPVGYDHADVLGHALAHILREKLGVLKVRQGEVVVGRQRPELYAVVERLARFYRVPMYRYGQDFRVVRTETSLQGTRTTVGGMVEGVWTTDQVGVFHGDNLAVAVVAAYLLTGQIPPATLSPRLEGRFQVGRVGSRWVVLDGAHNALAFRALRQELQRYFAPSWQVILGMQRDKLLPPVRAELSRWPAEFWASTPGGRRALSPGDLRAELPHLRWRGEGEGSQLMEKALEATPPGGVVVVTGSLYLVGRMLEALRHRLDLPAGVLERERG